MATDAASIQTLEETSLLAKTENSPIKQQQNDHHLHNHQDLESLQPNTAAEEKLERFVNDLISIFEAQLLEYNRRLDLATAKSGKWDKFLVKLLDDVKVKGDPLQNVSSKVGINIVQKVITGIECRTNKEETKNLLKNLQLVNLDPRQVRKELILSGIETFQCFESQFTQVTVNDAWQRAIEKLAADAVSRMINYYRKTEVEFGHTSITKGIIWGESKKYTHTFMSAPHLKAGHTLTFKNTESWNTAELFAQTGLVTFSNNVATYYTSKESKPEIYGYRLMFHWESNDKFQILNNDCERYTYTLTANDIDILTKKVLESKIEGKVSKKPSADMLELINQEANDMFKELETFIRNNFDKLFSYLEENLNEIKGMFENNIDEHKMTQAKLKDIAENVENFVGAYEQKKTRIWFDVKEPMASYVQRQGMFNRIDRGLEKGIFVIGGLSGMGKSELARKYARTHCDDYNGNVVWINASTTETMQESFHRLAKGSLKIRLKYENDEEKPLEQIVKEVYDYFASDHFLSIFDSAERWESIKRFLPINLAPTNKKHYILITSPNNFDWEADKLTVLPLSKFSDEEASEFVKQVLGIDDDSQNHDIMNFVKLLHNFPLALQLAASYLRDIGKYSKFAVADFIREYEKAPHKQLKNKYLETVYKTLKLTLGRIENQQKSSHMLDVISYLESNQIPKKLLLELANGSTEKLSNILEELDKYSVVQLNKDQDMVSVPGFVQSIRRLTLKEDKKEFEIMSKALKMLKNKIKSFDNIVTYLPHVLSLWRHAYIYDELIETYIVEDIVEKKAHINFFHLIAGSGTYEVFAAIVKKIAQKLPDKFDKIISANDGQGGMPAHYAASNVDVRVLKYLIDNGVEVNVTRQQGWTPLLLAVQNGYSENVKVLLQNKAQIEDQTKYGLTPLHLAARNGHSNIVVILLNNWADANAKCKHMFTPLHFAAKLDHFEILQMLLNRLKIDINAETECKWTPLLLAAKAGHLRCVEALLQKGANVNAMTSKNITPLHLAVCNGHKQMIAELLARPDIDVNVQTTRGNTPLHLAAEKGDLEIVKALVAKNARIDMMNYEFKSVSDLALEANHIDVKEYICSVYRKSIEKSLFDRVCCCS